MIGSNYLTSSQISKQYRMLQILGILSNQIQQRLLIPAIFIAAVPMQAFALHMLIRLPLANGRNLGKLLMFIEVVFNCSLVFLVLLGGMSKVYLQSSKCLDQMKRLNSSNSGINLRSNKWLQRFCRSCSLIKVRFASINFIDELTPLNCVNFSNDLSMQLLLLSK